MGRSEEVSCLAVPGPATDRGKDCDPARSMPGACQGHGGTGARGHGGTGLGGGTTASMGLLPRCMHGLQTLHASS